MTETNDNLFIPSGNKLSIKQFMLDDDGKFIVDEDGNKKTKIEQVDIMKLNTLYLDNKNITNGFWSKVLADKEKAIDLQEEDFEGSGLITTSVSHGFTDNIGKWYFGSGEVKFKTDTEETELNAAKNHLKSSSHIVAINFSKSDLKKLNLFASASEFMPKVYIDILIANDCNISSVENICSYSYLAWAKKDPLTLIGLKTISLDGNPLVSLPSSMFRHTNLQFLSLANNPLYIADKNAKGNRNGLKSLPSELKNLRNLKTLNLRNSGLKELPDDIGNCINLESLDLSHNQIRELPASIGKLKKLKTLMLNDNLLASLPDTIYQWDNIETIVLENNRLKKVPKGFLTIFNKSKDSATIKLVKWGSKETIEIKELNPSTGKEEVIETIEPSNPWYAYPYGDEEVFLQE